MQKKQQVKWDKTDHEFLEAKTLERYYRTIGDTLIMRGWITAKQVAQALDQARKEGCRLGQYLVKNNLISETQLLEALVDVQRTIYISDALADKMPTTNLINMYDLDLLKENKVLPVMKEQNALILAISDGSLPNAVEILEERYKESVYSVLMSQKCIEEKLQNEKSSSDENNSFELLYSLHENGKITYEQLILVGNYCLANKKNDVEMLTYMGLPRS